MVMGTLKFLVCSSDEPISRSFGYIVDAQTADEARLIYLSRIYAKDSIFRDSVLDLSMNLTFVERFYLGTPQETYRFEQTGLASVPDGVVAERVREFFATKPSLGEEFLKFMGDGDKSRVTEEMFEFIATHDGDGGVEVLELDNMPTLSALR